MCSGKNLAKKMTEVTLQFKPVPHLLFPEHGDLRPNRLSLFIQPDEGIHLRFETKVPGAAMRTSPVDMEFHYSDRFGEHLLPEAYERLLLDAIQGDASLFARSDEVELAWALVDPIRINLRKPLDGKGERRKGKVKKKPGFLPPWPFRILLFPLALP